MSNKLSSTDSRGKAKVSRSGFTLVEVLVATSVVGLAVTSIMVASWSGTRVNSAGQELTIATSLAQEMREWTLQLPFSDQDEGDVDNPPGTDGTSVQEFVDDLDDLMGVTYKPPRSGICSNIPNNYLSEEMTNMDNWSQQVNLSWRDPDDIDTAVGNGTSDIIYVQVTILHHAKVVLTTGWLVTR